MTAGKLWLAIVLSLSAMASTACSAPAPTPAASHDGLLVEKAADDPVMDEATRQARSTLDVFFDTAKQNDSANSDFALKFALPMNSGGIQYIWATVDSVDKDKFTGQLLNEPTDAPGLQHGSKVTFAQKDIVDWTYTRGGKAYGQFTTRAMIKTAPKDQQAAAEKVLQTFWPTPLPEKR